MADRCNPVAEVPRSSIPLRPAPLFGATGIPRKPNYDFERREREKNKAAESAKKAQAKAEKRAAAQETPATDEADGV